MQRRLLLCPSPKVNEIVLGILGRALADPELAAVQLHGFIVFTTHVELLTTPHDANLLARFMNFVNSNIARKIGKLTKWSGPFWQRRFKPIAILDDDALVGRMRYLLSHGCKEGFVERPRDWPGASCLPALVSGQSLKGVWYNETAMSKARKRGESTDPRDFATVYEVPLTPIPCLADKTAQEQRLFYRKMVAEIVQETRETNRALGRTPRGAAWVCRQDPHAVPEGTSNSPAPPCHSSNRHVRLTFLAAYRAFLDAYRRAAQMLRAGLAAVFPPNCFPPGQPFVPVAPAQPP